MLENLREFSGEAIIISFLKLICPNIVLRYLFDLIFVGSICDCIRK